MQSNSRRSGANAATAAAMIGAAIWIFGAGSALAVECAGGESGCRQLCDQQERDRNATSGETTWSCTLSPGIVTPADPQDPNSEPHTTYQCNCVERPGAAEEDDGGDGADGGGWTDGRYTRTPPRFPGAPGYTYPPGWSYDDCKNAADAARLENFFALCFGPGSRLRASGDMVNQILGMTPDQMRERFVQDIDRCDDQADAEHEAALAYCQRRYGG